MNPGRSQAFLPTDERRRRRNEYVLIVVASAIFIALAYLERNLYRFSIEVRLPNNLLVFTLINVNLLLLLLLLFFLFRNLIKLVTERRAKLVWSRLRTRLVVAFAVFSLLPTVLLFVLTTGMIKRSVEAWFKGQVDNAMKRSVEVVQTYYAESQARALHFAQVAADRLMAEGLLENADEEALRMRIEELRETFDLWGLEVYTPNFVLQGASVAEGAPVDISRFSFPFADLMLSNDPLGTPTLVETFAGQDMARGFSAVRSTADGTTPVGYVVADLAIPQNLLQKMTMVSQAYDEYWRLRNLASPLKTSYIFTLIMVFAMVILLSTWIGLHWAKNISEPIQELAVATREISQGNLSVRVPRGADDEIGTVIDSFNRMTAELAASKERVEQANRTLQERNAQVEAAKRYMETVLASVPAGVLSFDREGRIVTINDNAAELLGVTPEEVKGKSFRDVLDEGSLTLAREFTEALRHGARSVQRQWVYRSGDKTRTLLVKLTALAEHDGTLVGAVLVTDDLTELLSAQRAAAWREVARRIAHEIKNPLTPIQLSAQRLRKRYLARFQNEDNVFDEATRIIIQQVDSMKRLVDEFSQFARMPHANLAPNDLNAVVGEVVKLYEQAHRDVRFVFEPADLLPAVDLDPEQIKRVVVNLLDNAVAAMEGRGTVVVRTGENQPLRSVTLDIADTGPGIPPEDRQRVFEPYYTTKAGGTGLGLAIVKKIIEDHRAYIRIRSNVPTGAVFTLEFPTSEEKLQAIA